MPLGVFQYMKATTQCEHYLSPPAIQSIDVNDKTAQTTEIILQGNGAASICVYCMSLEFGRGHVLCI